MTDDDGYVSTMIGSLATITDDDIRETLAPFTEVLLADVLQTPRQSRSAHARTARSRWRTPVVALRIAVAAVVLLIGAAAAYQIVAPGSQTRPELADDLARQIANRTWPPGLRPDPERTAAMQPDGYYQVGLAATITENLVECAWYSEWTRAHATKDDVGAQRALRVMTDEIPPRNPDAVAWYKDIAAKAAAGDATGVQQYLTANRCDLAVRRSGANAKP